MKLLNIFLTILFFIIGSNNFRAQSNVIAKIGNRELTKEEFRLRYELSPRILSSNLTDTDSLKLKFLYSLISEKLWAIEAVDKGLANSEDFKFYYTPIEKMYVRDELFRIEIKEKVDVTESDISEGIQKYTKMLQIRTLSSDDSSNINYLYSQLNVVGTLDSLLKINTSLVQEFSEFELKFGDLKDEDLEHKLYKLSINEHTIPIQNGGNWFIFELISTKPNILTVSQKKLQNDVEEIIRNRRTRKLYDEFYKKNFGGYALQADQELFIKVSGEFYKTIEVRIRSNANIDSSGLYYLLEEDILNVKKNLGTDFLKQTLFNSKYGPVKVYDFLSDLTIVDVSFKEASQSVINKVLSNELKRFMQQETFYRIGIKMGVQYSGEVKSQINLWEDNLLAQILKNKFNSHVKVSDAEIEQYYKKSLSDSSIITQLNLKSLSTHDIDEVEKIYNLIQNEDSFEQIADKYNPSKNISVGKISDYSEIKDFGETMDVINKLKVGEIYGPIKTSKGYTFVKVVEPGVIDDSLKTELQKEHDHIYQKLFNNKLNKLLEDKTIELANKYGITISKDFLYSENYSDVNLFVHRYMGFGGRIAAVPFTTPFYKWYFRWKNNSKINP